MRQSDPTILARGIADAGRSLGAGLAGMAADMERQKQEDQERRERAKEIRGMAKVLSKRMGKLPGEIESADVDELGGEVHGFLKEEMLKAEETKRAADQERLKSEILQREEMVAQRGLPAAILQAYGARSGSMDEMNPMALAMLEAAAKKQTGLPSGALNQILEQSGKSQGPSAEMLAQLGFVPSGGQLNPNGTVSFQFGPPPKAPSTEATPITAGGLPTGKARLPEGPVIDMPDPTKATQAEQTFRINASELENKLNQLEKLVKESGNFEIVNPEVAALLPQLQYSIAINYAKLVDPTSVAREGEVASAQKYMLPLGFTTRNATTLAAIRNMREEVKRRSEKFEETTVNKTGKPDASTKAELDVARAAIKQGKDPAAVKARYKERTGQDFPE